MTELNFNLVNYRKLLTGAIQVGYSFLSFNSMKQRPCPEKTCLLRHDVDADLAAALEMARVEQELGIRSTYFLMTRSPLYNLLSRHSHKAVMDILNMGHDVGLHYDHGHCPDGLSESDWIKSEAELLESEFMSPIHAVSFHQPDERILQGEVDLGARLNAYSKTDLPGIEYFSDSNRQFPLIEDFNPQRTFEEAFANITPKSLQLLIHPMWWVYEEKTTDMVWNQAIKSNFNQMQIQLIETERAFGESRQIDLS